MENVNTLLEKYTMKGSNPSPHTSFKYSWKNMSLRPRKNIAENYVKDSLSSN